MNRLTTAAGTRAPILLAVCATGLLVGLLVARVPLGGIALIVVGVGAAVVLTRPDLVLLAMIAALPWENMLHYPSAQLSTVKGIGAAVFLAYAIKLFADRKTVVRMPPLLAIVVGLGLWVGMTTALSSDPAGGMHKLIRWALFLAFFCLVVQLVDGRPEIDRALRVFALSVGAAGAYTLYLFIGGGHGYRAAGPLEDPNDLAYLIACTLPIMAYLFKSEPRRRLLWGACFVLGTGAMLSTFSRGALVGVSALVVWGIVTRRIPFRALAAGILTGLILVTLAFTIWKPFFDEALHQKEHIADHNIESRESRWAAAIQLGGESPVLGIGTGLYPVKSLPILRDDTGYLPEVTVPQTVAHNSYLEIFAENGLPGLVLFVAYLVVAWMLLRKSRRLALAAGDERVGWLVTALQSSLVIAIVAGSFLSEELTSPYWLLGALAAVLAGSFEEAPATGTVEAAPTVEAGEPRQLPYAPGLPAGTAA